MPQVILAFSKSSHTKSFALNYFAIQSYERSCHRHSSLLRDHYLFAHVVWAASPKLFGIKQVIAHKIF